MMNLYQKTKKNQTGFTLVELMVVVVIIGVLVAIAIPVYNSSQEKAKEKADAANIRIIEGAVEAYRMEEGDITGLTVDQLVEGEYLKDTPKSPYDENEGYEIEADGTVKPTYEPSEG